MSLATGAVIFAMLVAVGCYICIAHAEKSYINFASPMLLLQFPIAYVLEIGYLQRFDQSASDFAYLYLYACLAISNVIFTASYLLIAPIRMPAIRVSKYPTHGAAKAWSLLFASAALYAPILLAHPDLIVRPREIYELTRTGFGLSFFLSSTLSFLGYAIYLCVGRKNIFEHLVFLIICVFLTLMHGSKGQLLTYVFIYLIYKVYIQGFKVGFLKACISGFLATIVLLSLFYYFSVGIDASDLYDFILAYSDYNRNGMLIIDSNHAPYFGRLLFENEFFTRIPRLFYPDKPKDFGTFELAKEFFPESFELDQGAPAFGLGFFYADFRGFTIFFLILTSAISGIITRTAVTALKEHKDIAWFVIVLFLSGVALIPLGAGYLLPEHVVLGILAGIFYRLRFRM